MIARLRGTVLVEESSSLVLDVHGVGYLIHTPPRNSVLLGTEVFLYTYLAVRENALDLYGFETEHELVLFKELIGLPKIGPKTALQILTQASVSTIVEAVRTEDPSYLTKMSGMGAKSAEKIVTGLKDSTILLTLQTAENKPPPDADDVVDALIALGYTPKDALAAVQQIPSEITDTNERIKYALRNKHA